jgi:tryptophan 2,3-dioxygenase
MTTRSSTPTAATSAPHAPAEGPPGGLSYGRYLRVPELTELQRLESDPPAHDELLFIVVHQTYELWFKQILFELESARDALFTGGLDDALHWLGRVARIERLLVHQVDVIESMLFQDFLEFRSALEPASGFQSIQFRELEALSGLKEERHLRMAETDVERARLRRRLDEPTLWEGFCAAMGVAGLPMPPDDAAARRASVVALMARRSRLRHLHDVAEALIDHDALIAMWRWRHVLMVERQIGAKTGTGGSSGASYLRGTLERRFFPDLWDARGEYPPPVREDKAP